METLLNELANLLHVSAESVSKIAESYPALRQQYIIYSITQNLMGLTLFTGVLSVVSTFFAVASFIEAKELVDRELENYKWRFKLWLKVAIGFSIFTIIVYVVASTVSAIYAPDINLIQDLITRMKAN
mgnify:CR=1 FL=1